MYVVVGDSKVAPFSGWPSPATHLPTLRRSRVAGTLTRRVQRRSILLSCLALVVTLLVVQFGQVPCIVVVVVHGG
jgi:hypothetical protein